MLDIWSAFEFQCRCTLTNQFVKAEERRAIGETTHSLIHRRPIYNNATLPCRFKRHLLTDTQTRHERPLTAIG